MALCPPCRRLEYKASQRRASKEGTREGDRAARALDVSGHLLGSAVLSCCLALLCVTSLSNTTFFFLLPIFWLLLLTVMMKC
jgi:hypothetical protein